MKSIELDTGGFLEVFRDENTRWSGGRGKDVGTEAPRTTETLRTDTLREAAAPAPAGRRPAAGHVAEHVHSTDTLREAAAAITPASGGRRGLGACSELLEASRAQGARLRRSFRFWEPRGVEV